MTRIAGPRPLQPLERPYLKELCSPAADLAKRLNLTPGAIRYHCRDHRGKLFGTAFKIGRTWWIPNASADEFVNNYTRETEERAGVDRPTPPARRSAPTRTGRDIPARHPCERTAGED